MASHKLTSEYVQHLQRFAVTFPAAFDFLRRLQDEGPSVGLWLSSAVNVHVYKGTSFIAYIKLKNPELRPPSLVCSPRFNQRIAAGTTDGAHRLFPRPFDDVLLALGGRGAAWVQRHPGGVTELTAATPAPFFAGLYEALTVV